MKTDDFGSYRISTELTKLHKSQKAVEDFFYSIRGYSIQTCDLIESHEIGTLKVDELMMATANLGATLWSILCLLSVLTCLRKWLSDSACDD